MAWETLPTDYTDATWTGNKKYNLIYNDDGTVSLNDVTVYSNKEKSFFGAKDANSMNAAINAIMLKHEPWTTYKTVVRDGWDINYIKIGYKQLYIRLAKTFTPSLNRQDNIKQTDKLPWEVPWQFKLSGTMMVATKYEMPCIAHMEGSLFTLTTIEEYPSPVSVEIYGVISVKEDLGDE